MQKIKLKNYKSQFLIFGFGALGLSILLVYWGLTMDGVLKISGVRLDAQTSKILLLLIAIGPFAACINQFILLFSFLKYGDFVINLDQDKMDYPLKESFKGFTKVSVKRSNISGTKFIDMGKQEYHLQLLNKNNQTFASIPGEYAPYKDMKPKEMFAIIHAWATSE